MFFSFSQSEIMLQKMCSEKKKTVRKLLIFNLFLALFLCFGLAACGQKSNSETTSDNQTSTQTSTTDNTQQITEKPYTFYTDPVEYWKDVVEKDQKNFFKIEDPQLNDSFGELYFKNIQVVIKRLYELLSIDETAADNYSNYTRLKLLHVHILNDSNKYYQNDYMTAFLEDAVNWCTNEKDKFVYSPDVEEIYKDLIKHILISGEYDVFEKKYQDYFVTNNLLCAQLNNFLIDFNYFNKKLQKERNTSIVYQLQDSQYCRTQAQNDYDCLSYLYNLTSNRKMIFFEENQLKDIEWSYPDYPDYLWLDLLKSTYISQLNDNERKELNSILERAAKGSVKDYLQWIVNLLVYDPPIFAKFHVVEHPVLRLNQVEVNAPAIVVQLNEVGLTELENLDIPENNKVLARNIIRNIQQANDYPLLNVNYRTRLMADRDDFYDFLEKDLTKYFMDNSNNQNK